MRPNFFLFTLLFSCIILTSSFATVSISGMSPTLSVDSCLPYLENISITNPSSQPVYLELSTKASEVATLAPTQAVLAPNGEIKVQTWIFPPCVDKTYEYDLTVVVDGTSSVFDRTLITTVPKNASLEMLGTIQSCPCSPVIVPFTVRNTGKVADTYQLSSSTEYVLFSYTQFALQPGQYATGSLLIEYPCSISGQVTPIIYLDSALGVAQELPILYTVLPCYNYTVSHNMSVSTCKSAQLDVSIINKAHFPNTYRIDVENTNAILVVGANQTKTVPLRWNATKSGVVEVSTKSELGQVLTTTLVNVTKFACDVRVPQTIFMTGQEIVVPFTGFGNYTLFMGNTTAILSEVNSSFIVNATFAQFLSITFAKDNWSQTITLTIISPVVLVILGVLLFIVVFLVLVLVFLKQKEGHNEYSKKQILQEALQEKKQLPPELQKTNEPERKKEVLSSDDIPPAHTSANSVPLFMWIILLLVLLISGFFAWSVVTQSLPSFMAQQNTSNTSAQVVAQQAQELEQANKTVFYLNTVYEVDKVINLSSLFTQDIFAYAATIDNASALTLNISGENLTITPNPTYAGIVTMQIRGFTLDNKTQDVETYVAISQEEGVNWTVALSILLALIIIIVLFDIFMMRKAYTKLKE